MTETDVVSSEESTDLAPGKTKSMKGRNVDSLAIIVVMGVGLFHAALPYTGQISFYIFNDNERSIILIVFLSIFATFAMPLLFLIAGRSAWYNLGKRNQKQFLWERTKRLFIPLILSVIFIMPALAWIAYCVTNAWWPDVPISTVYSMLTDWDTLFTKFIPAFFKSGITTIRIAGFPFLWPFFIGTMIPINWTLEANPDYFHLGHMWFLYVLFTVVLFFFPLLHLIHKKKSEKSLDRLATFFEKPGTIFLLGIPLAILEILLSGKPEILHNYASWTGFTYVFVFLYGFIMAGNKKYKEILRRNRKSGLIVGIIFSLVTLVFFYFRVIEGIVIFRIFYRSSKAFTCWFLLIGIFGIGEHKAKMKRERKTNLKNLETSSVTENGEFQQEKDTKPKSDFKKKSSEYLSRAQLPFYILHFPVLAFLALLIVPLNIPWFLEYLILGFVTIILTLIVYDLLVRRTIFTRFLLGVKEKPEDIGKRKIRREERKKKREERRIQK